MEIKNKIDENTFSNMEKLEKTEKPSSDSMGEVGKERIDSLKTAIAELEFLIKERESLSGNISKEINKIKIDIENFLLKNVAVDADGFKERNGLRQKQIDASESLLVEKVNCWRDVAQLKKELRERQKELSEKEERMSMLQGILE